MANAKKTDSKTTTKKSSSGATIKPFDGKIVPFGSGSKSKSSSASKSSTTKKTTSTPSKPKSTGKPNSSATDKKSTTSKSVAKSTTAKTSASKYVKPGTKEYWAMTPDQRNANTMINVKESIAGPKKPAAKKPTTPPTPRIAKAPVTKAPVKKPIVSGKNVTSKEGAAKIKGIVEGLERPTAKKTPTKPKPVAPKMATTIGSAKASVPSKGKVKIEANTGKPKSFTAPKTETKPKTESKATPKVEPKVTPKTVSEPIKMETVSAVKAVQELVESRPKMELAGEEKKGLFARMKERREAKKAAKEAEKAAEKAETAKMKKGGMVKSKKLKHKK